MKKSPDILSFYRSSTDQRKNVNVVFETQVANERLRCVTVFIHLNRISDLKIRKEMESTIKLAQLYEGGSKMPVEEAFKNTFTYRVGG